MIGLTPAFELDFIRYLQSVLCGIDHNGRSTECHEYKYQYGALEITESTPRKLRWNNMQDIDLETYSKLLKHWKVIDYDCLLQGWFRENCANIQIPNDIIKYMRLFICIPYVHINTYKLQCRYLNKQIMNLWNISSIYRKCWALKNNKECFRHKELSYCFKRSIVTLFIVDLSCYDELDPLTESNKMNRTIKLYQWFLKDYSLYLKKHKIKYGNVLCIFDKIELFKTKIVQNNISISQCCSFKKYNGPPFDFEACKDYISYKFEILNLYSNVQLNLYFNDHEDDTYLKTEDGTSMDKDKRIRSK